MNTKTYTALGKVTKDDRLEEDVSLEILRLAGELEHFAAERIKSYGLTLKQYNVLRILRGAGPKGLCRNEVRARMIATVPDATRLIDRVIAAGYAQKDTNPEDRRFIATRITQKGLDLLKQMDLPVLDMHRSQIGHMSKADLNQLLNLLKSTRKR